jgi:hypothetical protein
LHGTHLALKYDRETGGQVMKKNMYDKRYVRLEEVGKEEYIPFLGGRPHRETVISEDDIMNLVISLNTAKSFEMFMEQV